MPVEETSALCMEKKQTQQACLATAAVAEAAARQSEATAKTKEAAAEAATSTTATKFALSAKEEGKARFGYSVGY